MSFIDMNHVSEYLTQAASLIATRGPLGLLTADIVKKTCLFRTDDGCYYIVSQTASPLFDTELVPGELQGRAYFIEPVSLSEAIYIYTFESEKHICRNEAFPGVDFS